MALSTLQTLRITVAALRQVTEETQAQLAAGIHLTQDKISRRQSGASAWTLDDIDAFAAHWGLDILELLAGPTRATEAYAAKHSGVGAPLIPATFAPAASTPEPAQAEASPAEPAAPAIAGRVRPRLQRRAAPHRPRALRTLRTADAVPGRWAAAARRWLVHPHNGPNSHPRTGTRTPSPGRPHSGPYSPPRPSRLPPRPPLPSS